MPLTNQDIRALSAGTGSVSNGTIVFSNSNGISFGMSGSTITGSVGAGVAAGSISAGATNVALGQAVFSNDNNVSFGLTGSTITASASFNQSSQAQTEYFFSNSNGISFGTDGSTITASYTVPSVSEYQFISNSSLSLGTGATASFRHTSADSQLRFTSADSQLRFTSADSQLQFTSANSNFLGTAATQSFRHTSADSQLRFTSADSQLRFTSADTQLRFTSADSELRFTSADSQLQFTSANSNFRFTSADSELQFTSANTKFVQNWKLTGNTAGTTSSAQGSDLWLAGGNGVTISGSSNTLSFSVATNYQSQGAYLTTARASNDAVGLNTAQTNVTWTVNSSGLSLNAGGYAGTNTATTGGISVTLNTSGISLNVGAYLTTADLSANSSKYIQNWKLTGNTAGTTSSAQGTDLWLAGGNGVTISGSSNTLSFSVATNYQSQGAYLTTARASTDAVGLNTAKTNVTWTVNSSGISIDAGGYAGTNTATTGGISVTLNTSGISLNVGAYLTTADLSANSSKYIQEWEFAGAQTAGTTSSAQGTKLYLSGGNMMTLSGNSNTVIFSMNSASLLGTGATQSFRHTSADSQLRFTSADSQLQFTSANSNFLGTAATQSFRHTSADSQLRFTSADSQLRFTSADSQLQFTSANTKFVQEWQLVGAQTAGTTSSAQGSQLYFSAGNMMTLSGSSNTIVVSMNSASLLGTAATQSFRFTSANSQLQFTSANSNFVQATAVFAGTNASGTIASGGISVSVAAPGAGGGIALANSETTYTSGTANILEGGGAITIASTTGQKFNFSVPQTSSISATGIVSISVNASTISIGASQSAQTAGLYASSNTYLTSSGTVDARSLSFRGDKSITVGISSGEVLFSVGAYLTTADLSANSSKYIQNWKLTGNTAGTTSSAQGTDLWLAGGNGLTISGSSNTLSFSVGAYLTTAMQSNAATISNINVSAGATSNNLSAFVLSNSNNATFGLSGSTVTVSSPISISAGAANGNFTNIVFSNSNGISFGLNGSTITASATGDTTASYYMWPDGIQYVGTSSLTLGNSSMQIQPFIIRNPISGSYIRHLVSLPAFGSSTQASALSTVTADWYATFYANIFSAGVGGNSKSLQLVNAVTAGMTHRWMWSIAAAGSQSIVWQITYPKEGANTNNAGTSYSITSANINWSTSGQHTNFTGIRWLDLPFASTLTPGAYWMQFQRSTSSATSGGNFVNTTGLTSNMTVFNVTQASIAAGQFGAAIGSTDGLQLGLGLYSTNSSGGTTNSMSLGSISTQANQPIIPFQILRQA